MADTEPEFDGNRKPPKRTNQLDLQSAQSVTTSIAERPSVADKKSRKASDSKADSKTKNKTKSGKKAKTKAPKKHKPSFIRRTINGWFNRLFDAISKGSFSDQDEVYEAHRTRRDYIWNTIAMSTWGMVFPILTIVVTQLVGVEQAGMFAMAFTVALLLMFVANYGVRTYQVSDLDEEHSFSDYQVNRFATCAIMLVIGLVYCLMRGYSEDMFVISLGVYFYKMIDGLADVYEGRLQQVGKLYLAGISQAIRSVLVVVVFSLCLLITRNLSVACVVMAIVATLSFVVLTLPLALLETPRSRSITMNSIATLFKQCFPLFLALFLFNLIDSMPKFVMEGVLSYDNQLYYNALYFPAQSILIITQLIYKPQLVRMARLWADKTKRNRFDLMIIAFLVIIIILTLLMILIMGGIGIPIMSFLYGIDFEEFRELCYIMLVAGAVTAGIDLLYAVITLLRQQKAVTKLYIITFGFSLFIPVLLVTYTGLPGIIIGYLIIMSILFVLLVWEYMRIRISIPGAAAEGLHASEPHRRPSELRAERERLAQHRGSGMSKRDAERTHRDTSEGKRRLGASNRDSTRETPPDKGDHR